MANRKNNISDNEVKSAAGGYTKRYGTFGVNVYDNDTKELIASMSNWADDDKMWEKARDIDENYHWGKSVGYKKGYSEGKNYAGK